MSSLRFSITFHQPFLISSGQSGGGLDAVARPDRLVPAESLKGAMRAAATHVLDVKPTYVCQVFGSEGARQSSWAWTDAGPDTAFVRHSRSRNRLGVGRTVTAESLAFTEEIWQRPGEKASFVVEPLVSLTAEDMALHHAILIGSAHAVTALGQWRNRGMGTVTLRLTDSGAGGALLSAAEIAKEMTRVATAGGNR